MSPSTPHSTDHEWEEWGRRDPYFGVITDRRFRRANMNEAARDEFFASGQAHTDYVFQMIRGHIQSDFQPRTVLDFGCGVGRTLLGFAKMAPEVVGADVSSAMLLEADRNLRDAGIRNARLLLSDDGLSAIAGQFDLIHSYIVFQHIPVLRGRQIIVRLVDKIAQGGVGAIHFVYAKTIFASTFGVDPSPKRETASPQAGTLDRRMIGPDPEMQMNSYNANEILFVLQAAGAHRLHVEFTDHAGELGMFVFFQKPGPPAQ